MATTH